MTTSTAIRRARLDRTCADAVDTAREALADGGAEGVGDYIGPVNEGDRLVTQLFECTLQGYRGWQWGVVVTRAPRARRVTVCETALLPGPEAISAPTWVPWADRLEPGDVGAGDLLPTAPDDDRLMPAYVASDDDAVEDLAYELGVGRTRVMNREGRIETATRWYEGPSGPKAETSTQAPADARCGTCGFYLPLAGSLRQAFGACGNLYAADDGRVVAADHGCGAHSEVLSDEESEMETLETVYDDNAVERIE